MNQEQQELHTAINSTNELKDKVNSLYNQFKGSPKLNEKVQYAFCIMFIQSEKDKILELLNDLHHERCYVIINLDQIDFHNFDVDEFTAQYIKSPNHHLFKALNVVDDFAGMRNRFFDMSEVNADWLFFLDADEFYQPYYLRRLSRAITNSEKNGYDAISVPVMEFNLGRLESWTITRIVRKNSGIRFEGYSHETVDFSLLRQGKKVIQSVDTQITHIGYLHLSDAQIFEKLERNLIGLSKQFAELMQGVKDKNKMVEATVIRYYLRLLIRDGGNYMRMLEELFLKETPNNNKPSN